MKFTELEFTSTPNGSMRAYKDFDNGYGVSVIKTPKSYGGKKGRYELGIWKDDHLTFDTQLTGVDGVVGWLNESDVEELLAKVAAL